MFHGYLYLKGSYLLEELHDVSTIGSADNLEALEALEARTSG